MKKFSVFVLIIYLLTGCASLNMSVQVTKEKSGFIHFETGLNFKKNITDYKLYQISDLQNGDVKITYRNMNKLDVVTIFIYPFTTNGSNYKECLINSCKQIKNERSLFYQFIDLVKEEEIVITKEINQTNKFSEEEIVREKKTDTILGFKQHYLVSNNQSLEPWRDSIYLYLIDGKLIKFMFTGYSPKISEIQFEEFQKVLFNTKSSPQLITSINADDFTKSEIQSSAYWTLYGITKVMLLSDTFQNDTFENEVYARAILAELVKDLSGLNNYFTYLKMIYDDGFMEEYIWVYHKKPWWDEPENLDLDNFRKWKEKNLTSFTPETKATLVSIKNK
jgi:uncharacterized protein YcfL